MRIFSWASPTATPVCGGVRLSGCRLTTCCPTTCEAPCSKSSGSCTSWVDTSTGVGRRTDQSGPPISRRSSPNCSPGTRHRSRAAAARAANSSDSVGPASGTTWCTGAEFMFLSPGGSHYRRSAYGERYFHPAADGWYPERSHRSARPVLIDASTSFPGQPLDAWPAAVHGEDFVPPTGRGVARFVSDPTTARCAACRRAFPRRA